MVSRSGFVLDGAKRMSERRWVDQFCSQAKSKGLDCRVVNRINGWPETVTIDGRKCFTKSVSYNAERGLYFQGVDPKKLEEKGDFVVICGGAKGKRRDIFVIPWTDFFRTLKRGEPVNTYKPPKEYWQYKFHVKDNGSSWLMTVQGGDYSGLDVTRCRYDVDEAITRLKRSAQAERSVT